MRLAKATALIAFLVTLAPPAEAGDLRGPDATPRPRIVNGVATQEHATTGALLGQFGFGLGAICSGTLIGCETFLTAAHCVCNGNSAATCGTPNPAAYRVYLQHGGVLGVGAIAVNPAYDFAVEGDVAVFTLTQPLAGIPPTPINTTGSPAYGSAGTIGGFGITSGTADDAGLKRAGAVTTASCAGSVPEPAHVCWSFQSPLGTPGTNSNTCNGDSGGPLFVDLGGGVVVAGVTSGGQSASCLPTDLSFDADVFENRTFIESVAGADLANTACGTLSQVGDAGTEVLAVEFAPLDGEGQRCRKEVMRHYARYADKRLKLRQRCHDKVQAGSLAPPCPDAKTAAAESKAAAAVDPFRMARRCSPVGVATSRAAGACAGASDVHDLAACILAAGDAAVAAMLDAEYADSPPGGALSTDEARCQAVIAKSLGAYAKGRIKVLTRCRANQDRGKVDVCPDEKTTAKLGALTAKLAPRIGKRCTDAQIASLDAAGGFGGGCAGATTAAGLAACERAAHDGEIDLLLALLDELSTTDTASVVVPNGTAALRVTLNGEDPVFGSPNDLDIYLKLGAPASRTSFDFRSIAGGVFESITVTDPTPGTWHVLVDPFAGTDVPFQLTITTFQPGP